MADKPIVETSTRVLLDELGRLHRAIAALEDIQDLDRVYRDRCAKFGTVPAGINKTIQGRDAQIRVKNDERVQIEVEILRRADPVISESDEPICVATTTKGTQCSIYPDRMRDGVHYCHVHDPKGKYRQQHPAKEKNS